MLRYLIIYQSLKITLFNRMQRIVNRHNSKPFLLQPQSPPPSARTTYTPPRRLAYPSAPTALSTAAPFPGSPRTLSSPCPPVPHHSGSRPTVPDPFTKSPSALL